MNRGVVCKLKSNASDKFARPPAKSSARTPLAVGREVDGYWPDDASSGSSSPLSLFVVLLMSSTSVTTVRLPFFTWDTVLLVCECIFEIVIVSIAASGITCAKIACVCQVL